jgi:hypothetical protein
MTTPTTARPSPLPTSCEARCELSAGPVESGEARELIARLTAMLLEMRSPDGLHRCLRSTYSARGTCEVYPKGQHSPLCLEMFALLDEVADWWEAHPEPQQAALFERGEAV